MDNINILEKCFQAYIKDLPRWLPEGIVDVDLKLLNDFNLLNYHDDKRHDPSLTRYFHVIETQEKITLVNDDFVVWIVPEQIGGVSVTYTLVAINQEKFPRLEMAFATSGVYNTSRLVLRVLEKYLKEIQENEEMLNSYQAE
ncbi:MAG: hypothetical protein H7A37_01255 [Chlamydiales bacterium]|nr:hypothetical protein [Chlamydiia bacterium]MCP5506921.1 hypothetical protein [Chlamydiales bacterium]